MKHSFKLSVLVFLFIGFGPFVYSQADTLHIFYQGYNTKMLDSNETKIGNWAKSLNGKHVNIDVLCYYYDSEHKKEAMERSEELFLILNRKARELITIKSNGPKKGEKFQRTRVDIVYTFADGSGVTGVTKTTETKTDKKKEDSNTKVTKEDKKAESKDKNASKSNDKEKKDTQVSEGTKTDSGNTSQQVNEDTDDTYTIYVNGEKKVMQKKGTKKKK